MCLSLFHKMNIPDVHSISQGTWRPHRAFPEVVKVCSEAQIPLLRSLERFLALPQLLAQSSHLCFECLPLSLSFLSSLQHSTTNVMNVLTQ